MTLSTVSPTASRTLALAGVFQAAALVKQLARTGRCEDLYFLSSIQSILKTEAKDILDVYNGSEKMELGLKELIRLFTHNKLPKDAEIARYVFSLLHLEKKLSNNPKMLNLVRKGVQRSALQATHFSPTHENVMANLASVYTDTLSTFSFRIHVSGEPLYLNQTYTINKIRALLLAGIRSAVLWRQFGGRRWQLLISRTSLLQSANQWLRARSELDRVTM